MSSPFFVVIPARYASSRLPGKPLLEIAGKPMIQHVHDRAVEAGAAGVFVATDDSRVSAAVEAFGGRAVMTADSHHSGTDRLAEVAVKAGWDDAQIVVNLQGDEPMMDPELVHHVADSLQRHAEADMTTLATPIERTEMVFDPHVVKVVCDVSGAALYFSRAPIPWVRDGYSAQQTGPLPTGGDAYRHLGLYAYRVGALKRLTTLPPAPPEQLEALEQLRALYYGLRIHVSLVRHSPGHGVDTPEDLERVRVLMGQ